MNRITVWFRSKSFLSGLVLRYAADNSDLRKRLDHKEKCLKRTQEDYASSRSYFEAEIKVLQDRVNTLSKSNDKWFTRYLNLTDLTPETEQEHIDQIMQEQADRAEAQEHIIDGKSLF